LRIVSLLLLIAVIGGGFVWWQDQTSMRTKDLVSLSPEHVEVEGADGTTQIHPLDEPEDQAVAQGQAEGATALRCRSRYVGASTGRASRTCGSAGHSCASCTCAHHGSGCCHSCDPGAGSAAVPALP
jgi:cytoskeleton protein RodZ